MQLGPLTIPERLDPEFPPLARLEKEYSHTSIWLEATFCSQTQNYGCDDDSTLLVSGMSFFGDHAIPPMAFLGVKTILPKGRNGVEASAAARNVDPNQRTRCFALVVLKEFLVVFLKWIFFPCVQALVQEIGRCSRTLFACLSTMNWLVAVGFVQLLLSP